jgi:hypothetical protein
MSPFPDFTFNIFRYSKIWSNADKIFPLKNGVFWDITPCGSCKNRHRFVQEPHGVTSQKASFFIVTAVKTSNLNKIFSDFTQCEICVVVRLLLSCQQANVAFKNAFVNCVCSTRMQMRFAEFNALRLARASRSRVNVFIRFTELHPWAWWNSVPQN